MIAVLQFYGSDKTLRGIIPQEEYNFFEDSMYLRTATGNSVKVKNKDYLIKLFNKWHVLDYSYINKHPILKKVILYYKNRK